MCKSIFTFTINSTNTTEENLDITDNEVFVFVFEIWFRQNVQCSYITNGQYILHIKVKCALKINSIN